MGLMLSGCGHSGVNLHPVSGKVTLQGKPVAAGFIRFSNPQAGVDIMAPLHSDGSYAVALAQGAGLPEGNYQVAVAPPRNEVPLGPIKTHPKPKIYRDIPEKYRSPSTSGLTLTVKSDNGPFNVDMMR
jgi:hypothetical protein